MNTTARDFYKFEGWNIWDFTIYYLWRDLIEEYFHQDNDDDTFWLLDEWLNDFRG